MDMQTGDYIGGPLAAVYQAQSESANIGAKNLENIVKGMSLPKEQLEMQKYQALLDDPNYVKANAQFQMAATQAKLGDEEKKVAINGLDRVLIQLQAYQGDPAKQQEVIMQSFREKGVDPTSPMGQAILADPYGKTMEARDKLASTFGKTPEHMAAMDLVNAKGENALELAQARGDLQEKLLGKRLAATGGGGNTDKYKYNRIAIEQRALDGDPAAQRQVNLWAVQKAQSQAGGMAIVQRPDGTFGIGQKGDTVKLPFPNAGTDQQTAPAPAPATSGQKRSLNTFER